MIAPTAPAPRAARRPNERAAELRGQAQVCEGFYNGISQAIEPSWPHGGGGGEGEKPERQSHRSANRKGDAGGETWRRRRGGWIFFVSLKGRQQLLRGRTAIWRVRASLLQKIGNTRTRHSTDHLLLILTQRAKANVKKK